MIAYVRLLFYLLLAICMLGCEDDTGDTSGADAPRREGTIEIVNQLDQKVIIKYTDFQSGYSPGMEWKKKQILPGETLFILPMYDFGSPPDYTEFKDFIVYVGDMERKSRVYRTNPILVISENFFK